MKGDTSGPAFPSTLKVCGCGAQAREQGMTLRDYLAAAAMQGIHASCADSYPSVMNVAEMAYVQADAMLAVREKK